MYDSLFVIVHACLELDNLFLHIVHDVEAHDDYFVKEMYPVHLDYHVCKIIKQYSKC